MFVNELVWNEQSLQRSFHRCFLPSFRSFGSALSEENIFFRNWPTRNKNFRWWLCLLTDREEMSNLYRGCSIRCFLPSFGSFGEAVSEEKIFRNRPIRIKNCLWWRCWFMDWNEMSKWVILIEDLPEMLPTMVLVHLAGRFQRRRFS